MVSKIDDSTFIRINHTKPLFLWLSRSSKSRSSTSIPPAFLLNADAPLLRDTFQLNGMTPTMCSDYAIQWSGPNIRDQVFQCMMDWQRINHFPNSTELTRKDRLWMHFAQMAKSYGKGCFWFRSRDICFTRQFRCFLEVLSTFQMQLDCETQCFVVRERDFHFEGLVWIATGWDSSGFPLHWRSFVDSRI